MKMKIYIVFRHDKAKWFYYKEDVFDFTKTYKNKPVAIFYEREDALSYVREKNYAYFN